MSTKQTLSKDERLKSSLGIEDLLKNGHTESGFPLKIFWSYSGDSRQKSPVRVAVLVPRRKFKRAVDRNLMKRRIREAYRLNKNLIYEPLAERNLNISLIILFLSDEFISFERLESGMQVLLLRLVKKLS
ncbi:MAG TPA: ribonuclease P protein component [Bacteroides sp.]|nr:ribonuclease P protein component [Bacteroides sp.]